MHTSFGNFLLITATSELQVSVIIISRSICQELYKKTPEWNYNITERMICGGHVSWTAGSGNHWNLTVAGGKDACQASGIQEPFERNIFKGPWNDVIYPP